MIRPESKSLAVADTAVAGGGGKPHMLLFGVTKLTDMLEKGNVWYLRVYECYFKRVDAIYLLGRRQAPMNQGGTTLISVGSGTTLLDLILAPIHLYSEARRLKPDVYLTADQVFSWWTGLLVRLLLRARVVLMPVAVPEELYRDYGATMSGLPVWCERIMLRLSYASAYRVLTAHAAGGYVSIFSNYVLSRDKLLVVSSFGEALPPPSFVAALERQLPHDPARLGMPVTLIYVGRLNQEKLVDDLLRVMQRLIEWRPQQGFRLRLIGDGPARQQLELLAEELGVAAAVEFVGALDNADIPAELVLADAFMSPLTGMSLREAALAAVPIIAYNRDWIVGMLRHDDNALLAPSRDIDEMARQVLRLTDDTALRERLSRNIRALANELWTQDGLNESLAILHKLVREAA